MSQQHAHFEEESGGEPSDQISSAPRYEVPPWSSDQVEMPDHRLQARSLDRAQSTSSDLSVCAGGCRHCQPLVCEFHHGFLRRAVCCPRRLSQSHLCFRGNCFSPVGEQAKGVNEVGLGSLRKSITSILSYEWFLQ